MSSIFSRIRSAAAQVAQDARFVRLQEDRVAPYAASLSLQGLPAPVYDTEHHFHGNDADTAAFLLALDSVNFGSGYFPHLQKRDGMSGYFTVATSLTDHWQLRGPLTPAALRAITPADCAVIFGQSLADPVVAELMELFAQALRVLGAWLQGYDDDPLTPFVAAGGSAARLIEQVSAMPLYQDVARYRGQQVPLYKRAQLLVADMALAFGQRGPGAFHDLDELTIFADNLVPHVLRVDGLLEYQPELLARINAGQLIPPGSPEETEIRAVGLHAVERVAEAIRAQGTPVTARELDFLLWHRGQSPPYKAQPRHRARSVFY
ncbi:MAG: queuosine salvage family protein [Thermomicrobiales bacterium]